MSGICDIKALWVQQWDLYRFLQIHITLPHILIDKSNYVVEYIAPH